MGTRLPVSARSLTFAKSPMSARSPVLTRSPMSARLPVLTRSPMSRMAARSCEVALTVLLLFTASVASFECSAGHCQRERKCINTTDGAVKCLCDSEYKGYSRACLDVNDCAINSTLCGENNGGYVCDCDIGFTKSPDGRSCLGSYPMGEVQYEVGTHQITLQWPHLGERVKYYTLNYCMGKNQESEFIAYKQRATLDDMKSGKRYPIIVSANFRGDLSMELFSIVLRTRPIIQSEMSILVRSGTGDDDDTIVIYFTPTPESKTEFDEYRFQLNGTGEAARTQSRPADTSEQTVQFAGLVPGRLYTITMWTVSHNITSEPLQRQELTPPRPITQLNFTGIGSDEVTLTWDKPVGDYMDFIVRYGIGIGLKPLYSQRFSITNQLSITAKPLRPHSNYTFVVEVNSFKSTELDKSSPAYSKTVCTREALPPAPREFHVLSKQPSALNFSWQLDPADVDGVLHSFLLEYAPFNKSEAKTTLVFPHDARAGAVTDLPKGEYLFTLRAETGAGMGPPAALLTRLDLEAPQPRHIVSEVPQPKHIVSEAPRTDLEAPLLGTIEAPSELYHSTNTVTVSFRSEQASPSAGTSPTYTLVLAEQPRNDTPARLPSWHDVHALDVWPPYQVTEPYNPFNSTSNTEFTIGEEQCDAGGRSYCNGPLKPGTKYYVKLRIFTAPDNFSDTAYIVVQTDALHINYVAIIISSIIAMVLVLLIIIAVGNRCWIKCKEPTATQLPKSEEPKPFYLNLLFRKQCAKEIADIEERDYDEVDDHYEQINENFYEEIRQNDYE